jgi:hypothetical protein
MKKKDRSQEDILGQSWWHRPITPALRKLRQASEVILGYMAICCLKNLKMHYGCENAINILSEKVPEALMAHQRQQIEPGSAEDAGHTGHAKNEQWGPRRAGHQEKKQC